MRCLIENYRNQTAEHCGSGSMRNLIYHYCQLDLPEAVIFGLGSGLDCMYFTFAEAQPPFMAFGRSITMEQDLAANLGLDFTEIVQPNDEQAWEDVKQEVLAGRPTMLSGDIFYLDYREFTVHFPSHRFVLLGFDDSKQQIYMADRMQSETLICSMQGLRQSRNPPVGISTHNMWGRFSSGDVRHTLPEACELALQKTVARMNGEDKSQLDSLITSAVKDDHQQAAGTEGIALLADAMQQWHTRDAAASYAEYVYKAIVKFGTGGGMFRNLYADFLVWAQNIRPDLVDAHSVALGQRSAGQWNALADEMQIVGQSPQSADLWYKASNSLREIHQTETELFNHLGQAFN